MHERRSDMQVTQHALEVGERIREAYLKAGYNRNRFARLIDVNYTTIYNWEKGVRLPSATSLEAIAAATGTSATSLLTGDPEAVSQSAHHSPQPGYLKAAEKAWSEFLKGNPTIVALFTQDELEEIKGIRFRAGAPASPSFYLHVAMAMLDHRSGRDLLEALDANDITPEPNGTFRASKTGG